MPRAEPGKAKWNKAIKRGLAANKRQLRSISQLRAMIRQLVPDEEIEGNGEAYRAIFQILAYIDAIGEQTAEYQEVFLELLRISEGRPPGTEDDDQ